MVNNSSSASFDGKSYSLLLGTADVRVDNSTKALNLVAGVAFRVPLQLPPKQKVTGFHSDLRAFCSKDADSRVTLVADLGGETVIREFSYGTHFSDDFFLRFAPLAGSRAAIPAYFGNVVILIQRRNPKSEIVVQLDSIDIVPTVVAGSVQ